MLFWIHFCLFINIWSEIYKHCHFFCFLILYLYVSAQLWLDSFRVYFSQLEEQTVHFEFLWFLSCVTDVGHASYIVTISMSTTKCFFLTFLHATKHKKKELPNAWMPWTLTFLEEAAAQNYNMHEIGEQVVHYFATLPHHSDFSASCETHSIPEWHPFTSEKE